VARSVVVEQMKFINIAKRQLQEESETDGWARAIRLFECDHIAKGIQEGTLTTVGDVVIFLRKRQKDFLKAGIQL